MKTNKAITERSITTDKGEYFAKVKKYGSESFICRVYVKGWIKRKKVHEKIFIRKITGNSAFDMMISTINDYEHGSLVS